MVAKNSSPKRDIKKGKWSIVIRDYWGGDYDRLADAIYSVVAQSYEDKELIITVHADDNATRERCEKLAKVASAYLPVRMEFITERLGKRCIPLNAALAVAEGEYLSFLDEDDIYYPYMGEALIEEAEKGSYSFVYGNSVVVNQVRVDTVAGTRYFYNTLKTKAYGHPFKAYDLFTDNPIPFNTFVIRRDLIGDSKFDEELEYVEDWEFLIRMALKPEFRAKYVDVDVSEYRKRNDGTDTYVPTKEHDRKWERNRHYIIQKHADKEVPIRFEDLYNSFRDKLEMEQDRNQAQAELGALKEERKRITLEDWLAYPLRKCLAAVSGVRRLIFR